MNEAITRADEAQESERERGRRLCRESRRLRTVSREQAENAHRVSARACTAISSAEVAVTQADEAYAESLTLGTEEKERTRRASHCSKA